ncbi:hypothetical protein GGR58DRAFT_513797 [Xylaria digitata]|nr:hypothetical protein GGR58DRAFT_513797 [Xylaria digitata]
MIAFVEGDISNMPEGISLAVAEPTSPRAKDVDSRLPRNTTSSAPQQQISPSDAERSRIGREGATSILQIQDVRQQGVITHHPPVAPMSAQPLSQPKGSQILGLSGIQDITTLLVVNGQWAEEFAEYKVWTIQPFPSIDQTHTPSDVWGRCVISEEHLNIPEVRRRLAILDKNSMTVLEKMTSLAVSQQIQVQQSLEAAKSNAADPSHQWKFRQLDIIRSKKWLRPKYVKKIIVYVCVEPPSQAFKQPEESLEQHRETQEGPSNLLNGDQLSSAGHHFLHIEDKKKGSRDVASTNSDGTSSTRNSRKNIRIRKDENNSEEQISEPEEEFARHRRAPIDARRREIERANEAIASRRAVPSVVSRGRSQSTLPLHSSEYARIRYPTRIPSPQSASPKRRGSPQPIIVNNRIITSKYDYDSADESNPLEPGGYKVRYPLNDDQHPTDYHNRLSHTNDEDGHAMRVHEREAELEDNIYRLRRYIDAQRDGTPHANNYVPADRTSDLQLRHSSPSRSSYSAAPGRHRGSMSASRTRPRLLGYYTDEELRERTRTKQRYPDEFDREPYDPRLSPQEVEASEEAIEQLLLEWTPLYKAEYDNNNDNMDPAELKGHESSSVWSTGQPHSTITVTEEPEELHDVLQPEDMSPPPVETRIDIQLETPSKNQAQEAPVPKEPTPKVTEGTSRIVTSQRPPARLQRRETTDGIDLVKPTNGQPPFNINHTQTPDEKDDHDIGIHLLQKGDRATTLPTPTRQTWADSDWARNIVEETATVADPDEYEPPLRNPLQSSVTMRVLERGSSPRERGRQHESDFFRARQRRDIEHHRSPTVRSRSRNRSRVELRHEGSFERRPSPPPRRRTVEFEGLADRRAASRGRYRDQVATIERQDYVSEPRQRQQSRTRVREQSPYTEPYAERDRYYRSRPREDRH